MASTLSAGCSGVEGKKRDGGVGGGGVGGGGVVVGAVLSIFYVLIVLEKEKIKKKMLQHNGTFFVYLGLRGKFSWTYTRTPPENRTIGKHCSGL